MQKQLQMLVGMPSGLGEIDDGEEGSSDDDEDDDDEEGEEGDDDEEADKIVTRYGGNKHVEITELPVRRGAQCPETAWLGLNHGCLLVDTAVPLAAANGAFSRTLAPPAARTQ